MRARLPISASRLSSALAPARDADHGDPPAGGERLQVLGQVGRADELEDHVERAVLGEALGRDRLGAERGDLRRAAPRCARSRSRARPAARAELDRGRADAAGAAVDEQALARAQLRPG